MFALGPQEVTSARPVLGVNHFLTPKHTCPHLLCLLFLTIIKDATRVLLWKVTPKALQWWPSPELSREPAAGGDRGSQTAWVTSHCTTQQQ